MTPPPLWSPIARVLTLVCGVLLATAHPLGAPAQRVEPSAGAVLHGRVTTQASGVPTPVRRARVTLSGGGAAEARIADTDVDGRFQFAALTPGTYQVAVAKAGFAMSAFPSGVPGDARVTVQVGPGDTTSPDIAMVRVGAIEGRVSDTSGNPAINVLVRAHLVATDARLVVAQQTRTDDAGRFRLHTLNAGEYVIDVTAGDPRLAQLASAAPAGRPDPPRTYYPGTARIEDARRVALLAGQDARGIDVALVTAAPPLPVAGAAPNPAANSVDASSGARIAGRITQSDNGRPVVGAALTLLRWEGGRGTPFTGRTDDQGRFEFSGLASGSYQLTARADGFLDREYGWTAAAPAGTRIDLAATAQIDQANIALPRPGAIEGRLVDEFGDPVPGVSVQIATVQFIAGLRRLVPVGNRTMPRPTDDTGAFRIFNLPPDDYYVMATSGPFALEGDAAGFAPTFYPGTRVATDGTPVRVSIGRDAVATDFALIPAAMSTVAGVVTDASGQPAARAAVLLVPAHAGDVVIAAIARTSTAADGSFTFRNVAAGSYALQAFGAITGGPMNRAPFGALSFTAGEAPTTDVRVQVKPGASLRGRVIFEGDGAPPAPRDVLIAPLPTSFILAPIIGSGPPETIWADDGTFEVKNLFGVSAIRAQVRPDTWTMSKVTRGGVEVTDTTLDFRSGDIDGLEITFTNRAASVSGTVTADGKPAADYAVVVFSADPTTWTYPSRQVVLARPNQQGSFKAAGIPPGSYLAIALDRVHPSGWQDPAFLQTLLAAATPFTLGSGESRTLSLRLVKP